MVAAPTNNRSIAETSLKNCIETWQTTALNYWTPKAGQSGINFSNLLFGIFICQQLKSTLEVTNCFWGPKKDIQQSPTQIRFSTFTVRRALFLPRSGKWCQWSAALRKLLLLLLLLLLFAVATAKMLQYFFDPYVPWWGIICRLNNTQMQQPTLPKVILYNAKHLISFAL